MNKLIILIILASFNLNAHAQKDNFGELEALYESREYQKIIDDFSAKTNDLSAKEIYFVGMAHYMKQEDNKCIEMMDLSIAKDSSHSDSHFIKGMTLNYLGKFNEAIKSIEAAIKTNSNSSDYYSGLGDSYISLNDFDNALIAFKESTKKENPIDRPFTMIPQIYSALGKSEEALNSFYIAKEKISKEENSYITVLYNIGLLELLKKDYTKSEQALKELIEIMPEDYQSYAKIIQIYYAQKDYKKAEPYRKMLYKAYENKVLEDNLKEMFCFDQFEWKDKLVQVFERFEEKEGELYYKHLFYIVNQENQIEFRIQTENSPVSEELGGPKYLVGMDKDGEHFTFNYGFNEDIDYDKLKETVIQILDEKINPTASSKRN